MKRALEVISKLKAQVAELQQTDGDKNNENDSNEQLVAANNRIKTLEKQRNDLISAFRKQMKLIDLLKRQKMHIEASRLLSFTEDEFMKTLDWAL